MHQQSNSECLRTNSPEFRFISSRSFAFCTYVQRHKRSTLKSVRSMRGGGSVSAAGHLLRYKNKCLLWYQNRRQSLSLMVSGGLPVPAADRGPPRSANRQRRHAADWICGIHVLYLHARLGAELHDGREGLFAERLGTYFSSFTACFGGV